jgi:predicted nucleic acid-binding protein
MSAVVVDASVWIAAQDQSDSFCQCSREFFDHLLKASVTVHVPAFARVEVACALARKLRKPSDAEHLTLVLFQTLGAKEHPMNASLLAKAVSLGTTRFLRGADALYSATAEVVACTLVSWDNEHLRQADAITPQKWLLDHH